MFTLGILTISDKGAKGQREDKSGKTISDILSAPGSELVRYEIIPDEKETISSKLAEWADEGRIDVILTTGGTGLSRRDVTPEATMAVVDRAAPGFTEAMRAGTLSITPMSMLSRSAAGIRGNCLIINLPGSPKAVRECLEVILPVIPHAVEIIKGEATEHQP